MTYSLTLEHIDCYYHEQQVVNQLSLNLMAGEIGCLLGESGCGKTTVLRSIAGFEPVKAGNILLGETLLSSAHTQVPPEKRFIGMVFQDYALFPTMTVEQNIGFGLNKLKRIEKIKRVEQMLELTRLEAFKHRYPHEISGGQQQRVALARALAPKPSLVLLDEPFSNLDSQLRTQLARDVRRIIKHEEISALVVTHDQEEAFSIADKIGVMKEGHIKQWGTACDIYHQPSSHYVADFIGNSHFVKGIVNANGSIDSELGLLINVSTHSSYKTLSSLEPVPKGTEVRILIRPEDMQLITSPKEAADTSQAIKGQIKDRLFLGQHWLYDVELAESQTIIQVYHNYWASDLPMVGEFCWVVHQQQPSHAFLKEKP